MPLDQTTTPVSGQAAPRAGKREWTAFGVLMLPLLLVSMDVSVLYFAVPFISRDLQPSATQQLWIFDVYGFVLAGLLITMGALGDRIGRRRLLLIGAAAFGGASVAAAYAGSAEMLIACRALLGVGGATLMPSSLALVRNLFHDERERGRAIAIWSAVLTGGVALGPVLSGLLLEHYWWGSVFLINTPAMLMLLVLAPFLLPEYRNPNAGRFDRLGSVLSLAAILPLVYGIKTAAVDGLGVRPVAAGLFGLALGVVFIRRQRVVPDPMVDLTLFRNPSFRGALLANGVAMFALVGNAIFTTQYLQSVLGMSPLRAALWSLLPSLLVGGAAPLADHLSTRVGRGPVMAGGLVVASVGFAVLTQVSVNSSLLVVLAGAGVLAVGLVAVLTLVTQVVLDAVAPERAGAAAGLAETVSELGGALGIAVLGSVGAAVYESDMAGVSRAASAARETLGGAVAEAAAAPTDVATTVLAQARDAFVAGMHVESLVGIAILLVTAVAIARLVRDGGAKPR